MGMAPKMVREKNQRGQASLSLSPSSSFSSNFRIAARDMQVNIYLLLETVAGEL